MLLRTRIMRCIQKLGNLALNALDDKCKCLKNIESNAWSQRLRKTSKGRYINCYIKNNINLHNHKSFHGLPFQFQAFTLMNQKWKARFLAKFAMKLHFADQIYDRNGAGA